MTYTDTEMAIGKAFVDILREGMPDGVWEEIRRRNAVDPHNCASHDFCDANTVMEMAFNAALNRQPYFLLDDGAATDAMAEADMGLWSRAWNYASDTFMTAEMAGG